jgi:hypothetical protein
MIQINKQYYQLKKENKLPEKYSNIVIFDKFYNIVLNHGNHIVKLPTFILLLFFKVQFDIFQKYKLLEKITKIEENYEQLIFNGLYLVYFINDYLYMDHDFTVITNDNNYINFDGTYESIYKSLYLPKINDPTIKDKFERLILERLKLVDENKQPIKNKFQINKIDISSKKLDEDKIKNTIEFYDVLLSKNKEEEKKRIEERKNKKEAIEVREAKEAKEQVIEAKEATTKVAVAQKDAITAKEEAVKAQEAATKAKEAAAKAKEELAEADTAKEALSAEVANEAVPNKLPVNEVASSDPVKP